MYGRDDATINKIEKLGINFLSAVCLNSLEMEDYKEKVESIKLETRYSGSRK